MKNEEFAAAIARGLCAAPLRDYASNACGKPALDGNFSSPPKLGGVPQRGEGVCDSRLKKTLNLNSL